MLYGGKSVRLKHKSLIPLRFRRPLPISTPTLRTRSMQTGDRRPSFRWNSVYATCNWPGL